MQLAPASRSTKVGELILVWYKCWYSLRWIPPTEDTAMLFCRSTEDVEAELNAYMMENLDLWYRRFDGPKPIAWRVTGYLTQSGREYF